MENRFRSTRLWSCLCMRGMRKFFLLTLLTLKGCSPSFRVESKAMNHPIYMFQNPLNPQAVIIFFHHILWGEKVEDLHKSPRMSSSDPPVCWPEIWLRGDCPKAQILSTCYDSGIWKGKTTGYMDLYKLGENLRQAILPISIAKDCPMFLVGHGL